jgi:hypothetical protein
MYEERHNEHYVPPFRFIAEAQGTVERLAPLIRAMALESRWVYYINIMTSVLRMEIARAASIEGGGRFHWQRQKRSRGDTAVGSTFTTL